MRIEMFENCEGLAEIKEVVSVDITPVWEKKYGEGIPEGLYIDILPADFLPLNGNYDEVTIKGEYILDGTRETYAAAVANWKKIQKKLLERGFCRIADFENVEWF